MCPGWEELPEGTAVLSSLHSDKPRFGNFRSRHTLRQDKNFQALSALKNLYCAQGGSRTHTSLHPLEPQSSLSTKFQHLGIYLLFFCFLLWLLFVFCFYLWFFVFLWFYFFFHFRLILRFWLWSFF